jgi:hypothetical protein
MPTITVNKQSYYTDTLPDADKQQLQMLALTDAEIKRLKTQLAIAQTAKNSYARALAEAVKPALPAGDTLKFN